MDLRNDETPGRRVLDQDRPQPPGASRACLPSSIDPSSRTRWSLTGRLAVRRGESGTRWRRLTAGRQSLLALVQLRCGDTYAQLAAGFGIGVVTVYGYIREAVEVLARLAPTLAEAIHVARTKAFVILDGTLLPIDRSPPTPCTTRADTNVTA
jgi:hypothetical protein